MKNNINLQDRRLINKTINKESRLNRNLSRYKNVNIKYL